MLCLSQETVVKHETVTICAVTPIGPSREGNNREDEGELETGLHINKRVNIEPILSGVAVMI